MRRPRPVPVPTRPRGATRRPASRLVVAAVVGAMATLVGPLAPAATAVGDAAAAVDTAAAPAADTAPVTVDATLRQVVVDDFAHGHEPGEPHDLELHTMVELDGALVELPEPVAAAALSDAGAAGLRTGDAVEVTVEAPAGVTGAQALASARGTGDGEDPTAQILSVTAESPTAAVPRVAAALAPALGPHTVTVLPVHWGQPDTGLATLDAMAKGAAQFWTEQSGGRLTVTSTVRPWRQIAAPATCDVDAIMSAARAAHGMPTVSRTAHVAVYMPELASCGGWAGLGSISWGHVWINGVPTVDVLAHELGHNLGIGHASIATCFADGRRVSLSADCRTREYADVTDVMGYATDMPSGSLNTALADQLGFATVTHVQSLPATVDLAAMTQVGGLRAVAVPTPHGTVYVEFRPSAGRDVRRPAWAGIQARRLVLDDGYYPQTELLDLQPTLAAFSAPGLPAGGSWSVPGTGQKLTVTAVGTTAARIAVEPSGSVSAKVNVPVGAVDRVEVTAAGLAVAGWAADEDTTAPIAVHVYVGGRGHALRADRPTPAVAAAYPKAGPAHGFTATLPLTPGDHRVCLYAINTGPGAHTTLECRSVTVPVPHPVGRVDTVQVTTDGLHLTGWAHDPDTTAPIAVHVYVDGRGHALRADRATPNLATTYPTAGPAHGFTATLPLTPGDHRVCLYAINTGPGAHTTLDCRTVTAR